MATTVNGPHESVAAFGGPTGTASTEVQMVSRSAWVAGQWWSLLGAGFVLFWAYVLLRWVTGPYFHNVPGGPSQMPLYMKISTITWQAAAIPTVGFMAWRMLIRSWRRERIIATDGLLLIAFIVLMWQDPVSSFFGHWYTYNSHMFNMGAFTQDIPGWRAFGSPGHQQAYPLLFMFLAYPGSFFVGCWICSFVLRRVHRRWPTVGVGRALLICFLAMMAFDVVLEGFFWLPLGYYAEPGGHLSLFPDTYHKFALSEMPTVGALFALCGCLRYFKNDRGETFVERGIMRLKISHRRKTVLRSLALIAAVQLIYLMTYQIPLGGYVAANPARWPTDIQSRSYFTDGLCGPSTNRLCPGPGIPLTMDYQVNFKGQLVGPGTVRPRIVPFNVNHPADPYGGRVVGSNSR
jgi:Spirocyclase AveC-like